MGKIYRNYQRQRLQRIANDHFSDPANGHMRDDGIYELTQGSLQRLTETARGNRPQGSIIRALEEAMRRIDAKEPQP